MIKTIVFLSILVCFNCNAEPIADWVSDNGFSEKLKSGLAQIRTEMCLPDSGDFSFPVYPNAEVLGVLFGREKPDCKPRSEWEFYGASAALLSKDDYETVKEWYKKQPIGYHSLQLNDSTIFTSESISQSEWDNNRYQISSIIIKPTDEKLIMAGFKTSIEFNNPSNKSLKRGTPPVGGAP